MKIELLSDVEDFERVRVDGREAFSADGLGWRWADNGAICGGEVDTAVQREKNERDAAEIHADYTERRARLERKGLLE